MDGASEIREANLRDAVRLRCLQRDVDPDLGVALVDRGRAVFDAHDRLLNVYELVDDLLRRKESAVGSLTAVSEAQERGRRSAVVNEAYAASTRAMGERIRRAAR